MSDLEKPKSKPRKPKLIHQNVFSREIVKGIGKLSAQAEKWIITNLPSYVKIDLAKKPTHTVATDVKAVEIVSCKVDPEYDSVEISAQIHHWSSKILPIDFKLMLANLKLELNVDGQQKQEPDDQDDQEDLLSESENQLEDLEPTFELDNKSEGSSLDEQIAPGLDQPELEEREDNVWMEKPTAQQRILAYMKKDVSQAKASEVDEQQKDEVDDQEDRDEEQKDEVDEQPKSEKKKKKAKSKKSEVYRDHIGQRTGNKYAMQGETKLILSVMGLQFLFSIL